MRWRRAGAGSRGRRVAAAVLALVGLAVPARAQQAASPPRALAPLRFLLGEWEALSGADSTAAAGRAAFAPALQGRLIVRTSYAQYAARGNRPAYRHDDVMVIYAAGDSVRADYYDNEGNVIHYAVRVPSQGTAVFVSDSIPGASRYRLSYTQTGASTVDGRFEISPSAAPEAFRTYLSWSTRRVGEPGGSASIPP